MQDINFAANPFGGAQQTDYSHFTYGLKRGLDQYIIDPNNVGKMQMDKDDVVILSNVRSYNRDILAKIDNPKIIFHHDTYCMYRLLFPATEKCYTRCPEVPSWKRVFQTAQLHIFLSPFHYEIHSQAFGDAVEPHIEVPSPVSPREFYPLTSPTPRAGICNLNGLITFKGRENHLKFAQEHPETFFTFAGENEKPEEPLPGNCRFVNGIVAPQLNNFYNAHGTYLQIPSHIEPFGRAITEAYLAGCKLIYNSNVGCTTYQWYTSRESVAEHVGENASRLFWDSIGRVVDLN